MAWALKTLNARVHALGQALQRETPASEAFETELHLQAMGPFGGAGLAQVARVLDGANIAHDVRAGRAGRRTLSLPAYVVNPFALVRALADDVRARGGVICEQTPVAAIVQNGAGARVHLQTGLAIDARCVVVCTNAYTKALGIPDGTRKAKAVRNSMLATQPLDADLRARLGNGRRFVVELDSNYVFYRLHEGRLVYGGIESLSQTQGSDLAVPDKTLDALVSLLRRSLGGEAPAVAQAWSGLYHATVTETPIIERHPMVPAIVMNVGYGGTGVALTQIFAELAASIATGQPLADLDAARLGRILQETRVPVRGILSFGASVARQLLLGGSARPG
jgi:glycine/D-amino acid oxidase-like deaminating enzyme